MSIFENLNKINVNGHTEQKNGLTYLSWAWAWAEVKKIYPLATYTIYENPQGWNYFTDGKTCWVKTGVTIDGLEHIEYLPVMDFKNKSIPFENVTSFDVNKAIQRSLTKACARHGLGLYIYAGEDLPEQDATPDKPQTPISTIHGLGKANMTPTTKSTKNEIVESHNEIESEIQGTKNKIAMMSDEDIAINLERCLKFKVDGRPLSEWYKNTPNGREYLMGLIETPLANEDEVYNILIVEESVKRHNKK